MPIVIGGWVDLGGAPPEEMYGLVGRQPCPSKIIYLMSVFDSTKSEKTFVAAMWPTLYLHWNFNKDAHHSKVFELVTWHPYSYSGIHGQP